VTFIDRLARQPIGRLAAAIVVSSLLAILALVVSVRTASTQASVARAEAQRAIAQSQANSAKLFATVCQIADSQRLHPDDPTEPKPTTARGVRSALLWGQLWEQQGCDDNPGQAVTPKPTGTPTATPPPPAPTPTG
jgi:type II secretory pathway pseudopilin PulG